MRQKTLISLAAYFLFVGTTGVADETAPAPNPPGGAEGQKIEGLKRLLAKREKQFEEAMSGVVLIGHFTRSDKPLAKATEEKYIIRRVKKLPDGHWQFVVRIQYGKLDVNVPLTLNVAWADDTPVITLTDLTVPPLGTFTARVMIFRGRYAGTWQHNKVGGHLFGRIEKLPQEKPPADTPQPSKPMNED